MISPLISPQPDSSGAIDVNLLQALAVDTASATPAELLQAAAQGARQKLARRWVKTQAQEHASQARRVHYLSMEFLMGRTLSNALDALGMRESTGKALAEHAASLEQIVDCEPDAALGNGGLGRLAACFLDSLASVGVPSMGYGIRYEYGMFAQRIVDGAQVEYPDAWLENGTPWEFPRPALDVTVSFGGWVEQREGRSIWHAADVVKAKAFDMIVPGHNTDTVSTLRLWKAQAPAQIDLAVFNAGEFAGAAQVKNAAEAISWVLYPNDSTAAGHALRLRQEYFFVAASVRDILRSHRSHYVDMSTLADKVAIHLNDTHPAIAVAELMRALCDEEGMDWDAAWAQCGRIFSYTNHTLMPEALETWPVSLMQAVLPRHMDIIYRINHEFLQAAAKVRPGDDDFLSRLSLIDERGERRVRMAHLSVVGSCKVNGVSALHSSLLVQTIFADFAALWPERFLNITNGVTPHRWLVQANPALAGLIDETIGNDWRIRLDHLSGLREFAEDVKFQQKFSAVKRANKVRLAAYIKRVTGVIVNPESLFDVQVKRIHEYKRQLLNLLHVLTRYQAILADPQANWVPRTVILAGKAASSYTTAKSIIQLTHDMAAMINHDARIGDRLKLVFIPNYSVSAAEIIMPAADLSEQISTAGTEASGTGNMKLAMNGALTIGTDDGANIEIREAVGDENIFIFGLRTPEVEALKRSDYSASAYMHANDALKSALALITSGYFCPDALGRYQALVDTLIGHGNDHYLLLADYAAYVAMQLQVDAVYRQPEQWNARAIRNVAGMGIFSSERAIREYADKIWNIPTP